MRLSRFVSRLLRLLPWWLAFAALGVGAMWLVNRSAERLLARDAEQAALQYAGFIAEAVPGLDTLFATGQASPQTLQELRRLRRMGDVFRFKLYSKEGHERLVSDQLDLPDPMAAHRGEALQQEHGNDHVATIVLGGANHIEQHDGQGRPDRPALFSEAYVPVMQAGQVRGVVEVYVDQTRLAARIRSAFAEVALIVLALLLLAGGVMVVQAWRRRAERQHEGQRLRHLAEHDPLSGALNRNSFQKLLEQAAWQMADGSGTGFAVLRIDLDRFKDINDALGPAVGDDVLRQTANRLADVVRQGDHVARLGSDEFALLQRAVSDTAAVARLAERVVRTLSRPFTVNTAEGEQQVSCGASVGAARFGTDARRIDELLHRADVALQRAKRDGRGRHSMYDRLLDQALEDRRALAMDLRTALRDGGLSLHYQPLWSGDGGELVGYEALMRWRHPTRGMVPPSEFIPLAEETGQIEALGEWALQRACADAAGWPPPLHVAVNLSALQFNTTRPLAQVVQAALAAAHLPATRLELEITESLLISNTEAVLHTLTALSGSGVRIAMDDFGTGYSSLAYLWRFPFDKIKIDRAFTMNLGDDQRVALIVRSIISLAHAMGIRVNAEGVETEPQKALLQSLGCDELQGYLLGRPAPLGTLSHEQAEPPTAPSKPLLAN